MVIQILTALFIAFFAAKFFGKRFIPWLEKHHIRQYTKDEVKQMIYSAETNGTDDGSSTGNDKR